MKNANEYIINHAEKSITITKSFEKRSSVIGSKEFRELSQLHTAFPDYTIQRRTATVSDKKETHKGLTIGRMKEYVKQISGNNEKAVKAFEDVDNFYKNQSDYLLIGIMEVVFVTAIPPLVCAGYGFIIGAVCLVIWAALMLFVRVVYGLQSKNGSELRKGEAEVIRAYRESIGSRDA